MHGLLGTDISDHLPIFIIHFKLKERKIDNVTFRRKYSVQNKNRLLNLIAEVEWGDIYNHENTSSAFKLFHFKLMTLYNEAFPKVKHKSVYYARKPWLTQALKKSINPNPGTWGLLGPDACISINLVWLTDPVIPIFFVFVTNSAHFKVIATKIFNVVLETKNNTRNTKMTQRGNPGLFDPGPSVLVKGPCYHGYWKLQLGNGHLKVAKREFPELLSSCSLCLFM